jgi:SAM-dependent methyltransferase
MSGMVSQPSNKAGPLKALSRKVRKALARPAVGRVDLGDLDRVRPIDDNWGFTRGQPVDRYYIEAFMAAHASDIKGRVLEVQDNSYTLRYGGDKVTRSDILHKEAGNPAATIVADLTDAAEISDDSFDCVICTQTLQIIYDIPAALSTIHRILRPGGVLLATLPTVSQDTSEESIHYYWRFTSAASERLFQEHFTPGKIQVTSYGNVYAATACLHGLAVEDLEVEKLDAIDPMIEVLIGLRAVKRS